MERPYLETVPTLELLRIQGEAVRSEGDFTAAQALISSELNRRSQRELVEEARAEVAACFEDKRFVRGEE